MRLILVIQDHDLLRRALQEWLEINLPQHEIKACTNREALEMMHTSRPALIILDMDAASKKGQEIAQQLKVTASGTPLVILGTYEDQAHKADAVRMGASLYLPKSRLQIELVPTLKKLLTRHHTFDTMIWRRTELCTHEEEPLQELFLVPRATSQSSAPDSAV